MAKTRQQKEESVALLAEQMKTAKGVVFANFQGLTVAETEELRSQCREADISVLASKKTLVKRALAEAGHDVDTNAFEGGVAVFVSNEDEVAPAQVVAKFAKDHDIVTLFGGLLESKFITGEEVSALSKLPSKEQLLGQLVGLFNAPVSGLANVMAANLRGFVTVLDATAKQKA